eukprot:152364-Amphidinium_carterae.2
MALPEGQLLRFGGTFGVSDTMLHIHTGCAVKIVDDVLSRNLGNKLTDGQLEIGRPVAEVPSPVHVLHAAM